MSPDQLHAWVRTAEKGDTAVYHVGILAAYAGDVAREVMRLAANGLVAPVQRRTRNSMAPFSYEVQRTRRPWASHLVVRK